MRIKALLSLTILIYSQGIYGQSSSYMPLDNDLYHLIDRYEVLSGELYENTHTSVKPYKRISNYSEMLRMDTSGQSSTSDRFNAEYFSLNSLYDTTTSKKAFLKHFYNTPAHAYRVQTEDFKLSVNPVFYGQFGFETADDAKTFINTRGAQLYGTIDNKISFYTFLAENQMTMPLYSRNRVYQYSAVPNEAFWKDFKTNGLDFFTARGSVNFNVTKHVTVQVGHDKNFIGNGYRSMILSEYSPQYLFAKLQTQVWKLKYTNLFAQLNADVFTNSVGIPSSGLYPKKFLAFHHLSLNITKNLNIGLFESVISYRGDSAASGGIDLNYLNPVIFYRSVEQNVGSEDNALLGMDFKWNFLNHFSLYGQIVLDEFLLSEIKAGNGWWANKQAGQLGLKYINAFGIDNLDLQGEMNIARPYMYTHDEKESSYSHYNQPLAHPLGANFTELIGIARYQPIPRLFITGKLFLASYGTDTLSSNWGSNVLLPNTTREQQYGNSIAQGIKTKLAYADLTISYMLKHNLFIDLKNVIRKEDSSIDALDNSTFFTSFAVRWNIPQRLFEF